MIIAGAGGAAHLPGMVASVDPLPVIGVPVPLKYLDGMDSLLSIVQMPAGIPVATVAIGGARNAGLLAVRILAAADPALLAKVRDFQEALQNDGGGEGRRPLRHHHRSRPRVRSSSVRRLLWRERASTGPRQSDRERRQQCQTCLDGHPRRGCSRANSHASVGRVEPAHRLARADA